MLRLLPLVVLALIPAAAAAQTVVVEGRLRAADGSPAAGIRVSALPPHPANATSDSAGGFRLTVPVRYGRGAVLELRSATPGFRARSCPLGVVAGDTVALELRMAPVDTPAAPWEGWACATGRLRRAHPAQIDTVRAQQTLDPVALAAGLPPLRRVHRRPGYRELRISDGGGMLWEPTKMVRIVDDGGRVSGEDYSWFPADQREYWHRAGFDSAVAVRHGCRFDAGSMLCVRRFAPDADLRGIVAAADSLGVWTLPTQSALGLYFNHGTDQQDVTVEILDGARYGAINYYDPESEPHEQRLVEMLRRLRALPRVTPPSARP